MPVEPDELKALRDAVIEMRIANATLNAAVSTLTGTVDRLATTMATRTELEAVAGDVAEVKGALGRVVWIILTAVIIAVLSLVVVNAGGGAP